MSMILDEVTVPADTKPGDYVLGFRELPPPFSPQHRSLGGALAWP